MEILSQFGVSPVLLAAQVVNFFILLFILKRFLYKPILKVLEERKLRIEQSLKHAEEIEKKLLQTEVDRQKELAEAVKEAQKILDEGKSTVVQMIEEGRQKAAAEVELMIKKGREEIQIEREKMQQEIRENLADLVLLVLQKVTGKIVSKKDQKQQIEKTVKEFRS